MDNKAACTLAFTLGAATGATMALLLAPKPGTETRQQLADWADNTRGKLGEYSGVVADKAKEASHWVKETASTMGEKAHDFTSTMTERITGKAEEIEQKADEMKQTAALPKPANQPKPVPAKSGNQASV